MKKFFVGIAMGDSSKKTSTFKWNCVARDAIKASTKLIFHHQILLIHALIKLKRHTLCLREGSRFVSFCVVFFVVECAEGERARASNGKTTSGEDGTGNKKMENFFPRECFPCYHNSSHSHKCSTEPKRESFSNPYHLEVRFFAAIDEC